MRFSTLSLLALFLLLLCSFIPSSTQYYSGLYEVYQATYSGSKFTLYDFSRKGTRIRAKYFAENAYSQYMNWKVGKNILLAAAGAYSTSFNSSAKPVGLTVDNGVIVNRRVDYDMDALVIVYNGGAQVGGIAVVDLEHEDITTGSGRNKQTFNIRNAREKAEFLNWASNVGATVFQTNMMYSSHGFGFDEDNQRNGSGAERRMLAICKKGRDVHHIVLNHPNSEYLNRAAYNAVQVLKSQGFTIYGLLNLDTGGKNILQAYDDDEDLIGRGNTPISAATNLIVYYYE